MKPHLRLISLALAGLLLPIAVLAAVLQAPNISLAVSPVFRTYGDPIVARSGQHIVMTLPVEKLSDCDPVAPPFASFTYRDLNFRQRNETFVLRDGERQPLTRAGWLNAGERRVLGPFVIFVTRAAAENARTFDIRMRCRRPLIGTVQTRIARVHVPDNSTITGGEILRAMDAGIQARWVGSNYLADIHR